MSERSAAIPLSFFVAKFVALVVGGAFTVLALMAVIGTLTDNGWARLAGALAIAVVVPGVVADRLLPENAARGKGIVTDVFAVAWMATALVVVGVLGSTLTKGVLGTEAGRLNDAGYQRTARLLAWSVGGVGGPRNAPVIAALPDADPGLDAGVVPATDPPGAIDAGVDEAESADDGSGGELSPAELFAKYSPSVVTISGPGPYGRSGGTGFVVDDHGLVVTNHHVVNGMSKVYVKLIDDQWASTVELLVSDEKLDIAVLKIESRSKMKPVALGDSDAITVGERAVSIGNPLGLEHTLTDGLVSARRVIEGRKMIQMSTPISPGNSGGPLFNLKGEVLGVSTATLGGYGRGQNLNLAVPINEVKEFLEMKKYPDRKRVGGGSPEGSGTW